MCDRKGVDSFDALSSRKVDEMLLRSSEHHLGIAPSLIVKACGDHPAAFIHA